MRGSKAELTDRLRREGRWDAFKQRREQLKAEGAAAGEAWTEAAAKFPPASASNAVEPKQALTREELEALRRKPRVSFAESVEGVCDYMDAQWVQPSEGPDLRTWNLRAWARSSPAARAEFHRAYASKILQAQLEQTLRKQAAAMHDQRICEELAAMCSRRPMRTASPEITLSSMAISGRRSSRRIHSWASTAWN
jgi:hypothetical protein